MNFEKAFPYPAYEKCNHERTEIRKKIFVNGVVNFGHQCLDCGSHGGKRQWMKRAEAPADAPPWDEDLSDRIWKEKHAKYDAEIKAAQEQSDAAWDAEYSAYLLTEEWAEKRRLVIMRENGRCQGCMSRRGTQVHHMTYRRLKRELLTDLVLYCNNCHDLYHETTPSRRDRR